MVQLDQGTQECLDCEYYQQLLTVANTCASLQKNNQTLEAELVLTNDKLTASQRRRIEVQNKLEVAHSNLMLVMGVFRQTNAVLGGQTPWIHQTEGQPELTRIVQKYQAIITSNTEQVEVLNGTIAELTKKQEETSVELRRECSRRNQVILQYQDLKTQYIQRQLPRTLQIKQVDYQEMVRKLGQYSETKTKECEGKEYPEVTSNNPENKVYSLLNRFCELVDQEQTRINSLKNQQLVLLCENKKHRTMIKDYKNSITNYFVQMSSNQVTIQQLKSDIQQLKSLPQEISCRRFENLEAGLGYFGSSKAANSSPIYANGQTAHHILLSPFQSASTGPPYSMSQSGPSNQVDTYPECKEQFANVPTLYAQGINDMRCQVKPIE